MKKTIILLLTLLFSIMSHSQDIKFGNPWNVWVLCQFSEQYYSSPEYEYERPKIYSVIFDMWPIDGKDYCRARSTLYPGGTKFDYFREEEGKVYKYVENESTEHLFYNFAALEGDEFDIYVNEENKQCHCLVTKVDSVVIDNQKLKRITFNVKGDTFAEKEEVWIDVLGRLGDPLYNVSLNPINTQDPKFVCLTNYGNTLYITQPINEKHFKGQKLTDSNVVDFNHEYESLIIKADAHFEEDTLCYHGTVQDILSGCDYVFCFYGEDKRIITYFENYGVQWESGAIFDVSFRIPGYADGVYKITDLDGTHEVVCGDIPEGIKPVVQEKDTDSYDLQGRKQSDDARGIIIKDNRKVLKQ